MIRAFGADHQRKSINQTQFFLFENYVIRVMTPTNAFASSLQLSMAIKQYGPRQRTVWGSPARAFVAKARITLSRRTSPLPEGLTLTGHQFWIFGPAAGGNTAPDILNCPDPVPAYASSRPCALLLNRPPRVVASATSTASTKWQKPNITSSRLT